ncbi:MAG TPA: DUF503 domain-containing protein [Clostridia bacterium]|nr:DUF503 domain-containing protein [Clostridia bacterium]
MIVRTIIIKLYAPWVHSLKEKRGVVKSICSKVSNKFNVSIVETDEQNTHQTIVLGLAYVSINKAKADRTFEHVINFVEDNTDAEIVDVIHEAM